MIHNFVKNDRELLLLPTASSQKKAARSRRKLLDICLKRFVKPWLCVPTFATGARSAVVS